MFTHSDSKKEFYTGRTGVLPEQTRDAGTDRPPVSFLADDATSADQIALGILQIVGQRVITTDAASLSQDEQSFDRSIVQVINSRTRALSPEKALERNQFLARRVFSGKECLPVLQIDSRLRGIGNALRGIYDALNFDFLLFVPAEPELGRLVQNGISCHVEDGRRIPFHQSALAKSAEPPFKDSDLRAFAAAELGISAELIYCINEAIVSHGPDAVVDFVHGIRRSGKIVVIPDVTGPEHFATINFALKKLGRAKILIAGSRTFLHSYIVSFAIGKASPIQ